MVRVHEPRARRHNSVTIRVRVVRERDIKLIAHRDETAHRPGARAVHADLAVVVDRHEGESRIDLVVHDRNIQTVALRDRLPVPDGGAAERIDADLHARAANRLHVDDVLQIFDVIGNVVDLFRRRRGERFGIARELDALESVLKVRVRAAFNFARRVQIRAAAVRPVVFEAAVRGRIVRRGDNHAVGEVRAARLVRRKNRARDRGRRRHAVLLLNVRLHAVRGQDAKRRLLRRV